MDKEKRYFEIEDLRIEKRADGKPGKIAGYAAVFNKKSEDLGGFREQIAPGAFRKALKKSDARALINHDSNLVIGRQSSGTLRLKEDDKGLWMEVDPPDTSYARDLMVSIERGDINQQSFGFTVASDKWENLQGDSVLRTLEEIEEIFDVSPVTYPAYPDTTVALRSKNQKIPPGKEEELTPKDSATTEPEGDEERDATISDKEEQEVEIESAEYHSTEDLLKRADELIYFN